MTVGNRIVILGCPGSGKSTFARKLHERTGLPLIYLDRIWWRADRSHISRKEFDLALEQLLRGREWIIDGDYSRTFEMRVRACDTVIFLDYSEETCMEGIRSRIGRQREDMPWTETAIDPELEAMVRNYRRDIRPAVYALLEKYPEKQSCVFSTRAFADAWLAGF